MKQFNFLLGILFFNFASIVSPTVINGRFSVLDLNSLEITILLQINSNTGTDKLGGATIVFDFDTTAVSITGDPIKDFDYQFHNFCGGNYSAATVTRPTNGTIWVNIDLPDSAGNDGTVIKCSPEWTDLVTIHFKVLNFSGTVSLSWISVSPFWGIYDADNTNLFGTGVFLDLTEFPLPVELISFTSKLINGNVLLNWVTQTEVNNYGFEVERKINEMEWERIGFVEGHGNSNSPKLYSFTDHSIIGGIKFQYRLKQIDTDGQYEYSEIAAVELIPGNFTVYQNYPNPFNPITKIRYELPEQGIVEIKIFNVVGMEVNTLLKEKKDAGVYEAEFNAQGLTSGIYFYRITTENISNDSRKIFSETKKMVLMK